MLIIGAMGMAVELLEILSIERKLNDKEIVFFDDINTPIGLLFNRFTILRSIEEVKEHFKKDKNFVLGLGNPKLRKEMSEKFLALGGKLNSLTSNQAHIGNFNTKIDDGCILMQGVIITNNVYLEKGVLVNLNTTISHDCTIGAFTEIACNVTIPGRCRIGKGVFIGSNSTLNPNIKIGDNAIIGAGAVIIRDVPDNAIVVGNPAKPLLK